MEIRSTMYIDRQVTSHFRLNYNFSPVVQPIPLDFLSLAQFNVMDPPVQRGSRLLPFGTTKETESQNRYFNPPTVGASSNAANSSRAVYPCTIHHRHLGGFYTLFAESPQARLEWKAKLEEAMRLRRVIQEPNR